MANCGSWDRVDEWLAGGGGTGELVRATDWGATPLGPPGTWPRSLRTAASICLNSSFPMLVMWGPELVMLYNDGYRPILGESKHPRAMGQRVRDCWWEIWPDIGPLLNDVLTSGAAVWREDQHLRMVRNGYPEECYFTFSFSPIPDDAGGVGGVLTTVTETTERVLGERRLRTLHELAQGMAGADSMEETCAWLTTALAADPADLPFALVYLVSDGEARLASIAGVPGHSQMAAARFPIAGDAHGWPVVEALTSAEPVAVDLVERFGAAAPAETLPATTALVLPCSLAEPSPGDGEPEGLVLVAGVSPRRPLDDEYRRFLQLVAHHAGTAVATARARAEERARAELDARAAALASSEARFRSFAEDTPALVWTSGTDGGCDYFNPAWLAFTGRTLEQELGRGWVDGVHPEDREEVLRVYLGAVAARTPFETEYRLRHASGEYRWILDAGGPRHHDDGTLLGFGGTCLDITDRRRAEMALRTEEEWLRSLNDCSPVGIFTTDHAGLVTYTNPTFGEIVGLTPPETMGEGWLSAVHPEERERVAADWRAAVLTGRPVDTVMRVQNRERGLRWVRARTAPLRLGGGAVVGHVGTNEDITEQREMEVALRRAEFQSRELVELAQAVVWRGVGELPRITFVNGRAAELSGIPVERWTSEPMLWVEQTLPEDREAVLEAVRRSHHAPREVEHRMRDVHGRVICLRNFIRYVGETAAGPEYIGVMFDETALRRTREEVEESRVHLRELADRLRAVREQEQARIAREIHDELGQMLTGLKLQLSWLAGRLPAGEPKLAGSAGEMLSLVDATIDTVRRIATRLRPGVLDDLGLYAALEWLAHDFEHRTGVPCRLSLPRRPCTVVEAHATTVFRITQEALTNVARHAEASIVQIGLRCEGDQCVLSVVDDGRGMPPEASLAQPSLGLLGMRERAIASGGGMEIRSRPGRGTEVMARVGGRPVEAQGATA